YLIGNNAWEQINSSGNAVPNINDVAGNGSFVFYVTQNTACLPAAGGNCSGGNFTYAVNPTDCCNQWRFPGVQMEALSSSSILPWFFGGGDYGYGFISQTGGSTTPSIHARTVVVNAASIDVDGTISVGSNWSVYLPASLTAPVTVTPAKTYTFCFFGCYSYTVAAASPAARWPCMITIISISAAAPVRPFQVFPESSRATR